MTEKKIKVVLAKPGLDSHDRGIKVVVRGLRDAGMEVIFLGFRQKIDSIIAAAVQEDADVVGLGFSAGSSLPSTRELVQKLRGKNVRRPLLVVGGNILDQEIAKLKDMGIDGVFPSGTFVEKIVDFVSQNVKREAGVG